MILLLNVLKDNKNKFRRKIKMIKIKMRKAVTGIACIFSIIMLICKIVSQNVYGMEAEMIINKSNEVYYLSAEQLSVDSNNVVS